MTKLDGVTGTLSVFSHVSGNYCQNPKYLNVWRGHGGDGEAGEKRGNQAREPWGRIEPAGRLSGDGTADAAGAEKKRGGPKPAP